MIQEFAQYLLSIRGYSENTIKAYACDLQSFSGWMKQHKADARWSTTTREDIDKYICSRYEQGMKPSTTNRQLAAIASLFRYFQRQGLMTDNPCKYESRRKLPKTIPAVLQTSQLILAYQRANGVRKTMLGLLASTGIRIQEMLDLTWEDIDFQESSLRITGKGAKQRKVYSTKDVLCDLHTLYERTNPSGKMFHLTQRQARYMIYEALFPYCQSTHLNPHTIRHTFATELAKDGENVVNIAKVLGHNHIETSQKYINLAEIPTTRKGICLT